jgi:hypothetical protein
MDWRPIETAPRDGTEIILAISGWPPDRKWVCVGWWEQGDSFPWRFIDTFSLEPTGCCEDEDGDRCPVNGAKAESVTHWQPLPEFRARALSSETETGGEG